MSRWLSSVNNLLEQLDDQVENVRDVLTEQQESDEEEEYDDEDDEESSEEEEEQIDLIAAAEDGAALLKNAFFSAVPKARTAINLEKEEQAEDTASPFDTPQPKPPRPPGGETKAVSAAAGPPRAEVTPVKATTSSAETPIKSNPKSTAPPPVKPSAEPTTFTPKPPPPPKEPQPTQPAASIQEGPGATGRTATQKQAPKASSGPPGTDAKNTTGPPSKTKAAPPPPSKPGKPPASTQPPQQPSSQPPPPHKSELPPGAPAIKGTKPTHRAPNSTGGNSGSGSTVNTNNKQQVLAELRQLKKQVHTLQQQLSAAHKEIKAQQKELDSAATMVEGERQDWKEEKEDLQEDHDEEIAALRQDYDETLVRLKAQHKQELQEMRHQLSQEKAERQQEGGDLSQDLQEALERERAALQEVASLQQDKSALEGRVQKLELQQATLQENLESALAAQETAVQRQQAAEVALDDVQEQHKRQMKQRQVREAELEKTIADLGTALTANQQQDGNTVPSINQNGYSTPARLMSPMPPFTNADGDKHDAADFKKKYEVAEDEAEALRGTLILESRKREALRRELDEMNQERAQEAAAAQEQQRHYDKRLEEQSVIIARLESALRDQDGASETMMGDQKGTAQMQKIQRQLEEAKSQVTTLSEQLLRQQGNADARKSEILTLKGRLQAANARAEEAERTVFQTTASISGSANESESGFSSGYKTRRRVKGGGRGRGGVTIRSIRTALNMGPGSGMEAFGKTVEALDLWMIDTGTILRHEPLARLAFFVYFSILHLWCFCLVVFHTSSYETPHGDFPSALRGAKGGVGMNVGGPGGP